MPWARTVRPPVPCGPCGAGSTGSSVRRGSACADGSRAPCDGDGCSAGTYACSRLFLRRVRGMSTPLRGQCWAQVRQLRPAPPTHAAAWWRIVDVRHPSTWSDRPTVRGGERGGQTHDDPSRRCLWMTSCRTRRQVVTFRGSAISSKPRSHQRSQPSVSRVTRPATVPLTCRNSGGTIDFGRPGRPIELVGPGSSQLVDNSVDHRSAGARCEPQDNGEERRRSGWTTSR